MSQQLDLHYLSRGPADAPPLLLIHGGRDHAHSWDFVAQRLCDKWRVIAPDLRGHGDSAWAPGAHYAMDDFLLDLCELTATLGLSEFSLVGHSLGGNIALRYAGLFPEQVRRLVVIEGLGPAPALVAREDAADIGERLRTWISRRRARADRKPRLYPDADAAVSRMRATNPHLTEKRAHYLVQTGTRRLDDGNLVFKHDPALDLGSPIDLSTAQKHRLWSNVACPTLLVYGRESWASDPAMDGRAAYFRNARVEMFDNAGHWIHHDREAEFIALLREFL